MSAKLKPAMYTDHIELYSLEVAAKINNGEYPIHLAKDGKYEYKFVSETELDLYTNYDATDEDAAAITQEHGYAPIVWDGIDTGGVPFKELNHTNDETINEETN
jgi:hypothetical protein